MKNAKPQLKAKIKNIPNYKNKKILILGLGLLGRGLKDAIFFAEREAKVTVTDLKTEDQLKTSVDKLKKYPNIKFSLGGHKKQDILKADLIIRNAGVPIDSEWLKFARKHKKKIDMDESLFAEYCPCPIIGITGTRGKSTTTTLLGQILKDVWETTSRRVYIAGNLQGEATLPLIDKVTKNDLVVLELSSWQLQGFGWKKISPHIAVFTNIFPDHLNYYKSMRSYINDKKLIFKFQKKNDYCIINNENNYTKKIQTEIKSKMVPFFKGQVPTSWKLNVQGDHNLENIAAALNVCKALKISKKKARKSIESFSGVEHRMEIIKKINNITFVNDTTSTTPTSTEAALESIDSPVVLIAGGASKSINLSPLAKTITKNVKVVILLEGSATDELEQKIIRNKGENVIAGRFDNFAKAVERAYSLSLPGDTVLLSPGCASFGMFINEFDRGDQFKKIVNQLH
ncbi:UDP-N-acetylmuramoyl-L-alanine--D-glutamate ligase [Candidatus Kuenenbacteria bacterium]|nr:UDP-N-acetylmuramoyl-L-alanine--D-glutamate ligase [Candidatus Kuenenbacteria bacterium]